MLILDVHVSDVVEPHPDLADFESENRFFALKNRTLIC